MSDLMAELVALNQVLAQAPVQENGGEFPDGNYEVLIEKAELTKVKNGPNAGKPAVEWWLRVLQGPEGTANRVIFHYHRLYGRDQEQLVMALSRLKTDVLRLGQELVAFEQLPAILDVLVQTETRIRVTLKTGQAGIQNCYFNGVVR